MAFFFTAFIVPRPVGNNSLMGCDGWSCHQTVNRGGVAPWGPDKCQIPQLPSSSTALQSGISHSLLGPGRLSSALSGGMAWVRALLESPMTKAALQHLVRIPGCWTQKNQSQIISIQCPETFNLSAGWAKPLKHCCPPEMLSAAPPPPVHLCLRAVQLALFFLSWCL